jgi:4-amino-4-deoxy-L-arabinose transferase-like glycosyltransferase
LTRLPASRNGNSSTGKASGKPAKRALIFDGHATPVKTALFFILCAAWILPGLVGRDPWKSDDAIAFGVIHDMLRAGAWAIPSIAGQVHAEYPPLYHWLAAATATLFSPWLPLHDGARLASGLLVAIAFLYAKKTATRLNDEPAGRIAVLLLLGSVGLLLRGHEMNPELGGLAGFTIALYGLTRIRSEAGKGGVTTGVGAGLIAMSVGLVPALFPAMIALVTMGLLRDGGNRTVWRGLALSLVVLLPFALVFPLLLLHGGENLAHWMGAILGIPVFEGRRITDYFYFLSVLPWYALPTLPFALWVWSKDRARIRERFEIALPLASFAVLLLGLSLFRKGNDAVAMVLLVPLALAASSAPDRLPRGLARFVDWFGLVFFGLGVMALWLYWTAAITGFPAGAARAVARQAPGFAFEFSLLPFLICAVLTSIWIYAVARSHRNNRRAIVNWSAGITILWVLPNLLALSAFDHVRSYRGVAAAITSKIAPGTGCIAVADLGDAQRALLQYFVRIY